ncbi:MAG TPA: ISAs1 family transposase [Candidatus Ozemobacteraceae bacterium]|nr:ISAs1 family transposase [Candidatus Ozemobacteraceae bacterium]
MAKKSCKTTLLGCLSILPDPRQDMNKLHLLLDILVIAVCAAVAGAEGWNEVEEFGRTREAWLKRFLSLPHGIPSHDTFRDVFLRLDPTAFSEAFMTWTRGVHRKTNGTIAIDGKTVRRSGGSHGSRHPLHLVSAWATEAGVCLGQVATSEKSNEITAIPTLLQMLELKGCLITIDAMGTQCEIAKRITAQCGDYILPAKENQPNLHDQIRDFFTTAEKMNFQDVEFSTVKTVEKDHGRVETRTYHLVRDLEWFDQKERWANIAAIGRVVAERRVNGKTSVESRYFITSWKGDIHRFADAVRRHWGIENSLHWVLDVVFDEDHCRKRILNSPENFAIVRKFALALLKRDTTSKGSIRGKRYRATLDTDYLEKVILG